MKYITIILILLCAGCMEETKPKKPDPAYIQLSKTIDDYKSVDNGTSVWRVSHLPNFNENNLDHWKALIKHTSYYPSISDKTWRWMLIDNVTIPNFQSSTEMQSKWGHHTIACLSKWPNGTIEFQPNEMFCMPNDYFKTYNDNIQSLQALFPSIAMNKANPFDQEMYKLRNK